MKPQTIEKTGKFLKLQLALSVLAILVGVVWWVAAKSTPLLSETTGIKIAAGAFGFYLITRLRIWWNHG